MLRPLLQIFFLAHQKNPIQVYKRQNLDFSDPNPLVSVLQVLSRMYYLQLMSTH